MRTVLTTSLLAAGALAATAPAALASHDADFSIDRVAVGLGGSVTASGSITCPAPQDTAFYDLSFDVRQRAGHLFTVTGGYLAGTCDSAGPKKWSTTLLFGSGPFHGGKAIVSGVGTSCAYRWDPYAEDCDSDVLQPVEMRLVKG